MRTFRASGVDSVLRDIDEEERFKARISANHLMPAEIRRKRLAALKSADKEMANNHSERNRAIDEERARVVMEEINEGGAE